MAYHTIVSHDHIVARAHNHIGSATIVVNIAEASSSVIRTCTNISVRPIAHRFSIIVGGKILQNEAVGYLRVDTIHVESATSCTVTMSKVVGDDEVFEFNTMEHSHASTTVTVSHIINNVAVANGESVPLHIFVFLIYARFVAADIIFPVPATAEAAVFVGTIRRTVTVSCHMPSCHTNVRLIQNIVSLAHAGSVTGNVCGTFIYYFRSKRGYVKIVTCTACHWRFLAYLKYSFIIGLFTVFVCRTSRNVLRKQRFAFLFAWISVLGETSINLDTITDYKALIVGIYTGSNPYHLRFESCIVLVQGVVLGSHFHCQLQTADISFLAVVVDTVIVACCVCPVPLVGIALIILVPRFLAGSSILIINSPVRHKEACIVSRRRTIIGFGACWSGSCAEIR